MKKQLIIPIIIIQIIIIGILGINIYKQKSRVLGEFTINPINKDSIIIEPDSSLKYFWEPKPNEKLNPWYPNTATYAIDPETFNETRTYAHEKPENTFRIITIGDSFTFGLYVDTKDNWTEILEENLNHICPNNIEVINLGVSGYDIQYAIKRYEKRGQIYNPDLIVWFLKDDDFLQINELMLKLEQKFFKEMSENGEMEKEISKGNYYPSWTKALKESHKIYGERNILNRQRQFLTNFIQNTNKKILFITYPFTINEYKDILRSYASTALLEITSTSSPELHLPNDGHPNELGHKVIAKDLEKYLLTNKVFNCTN